MNADHRAEAEWKIVHASPTGPEDENRLSLLGIAHALLAIHDLLEQRLPEPDAPSESETDPHAPCGCDREGENTPPASTASGTPRPGGRIEATVDGHRGVLVWADHPGCIVPGWVWEDRPDCCVADRDVHAHRVLPPQAPATAPESDAQPEDVSEDAETENGPENAVQGRIGWLRMRPGDDRCLMREVPGGGWIRIDTTDDSLVWSAKHLPDAEFTPIRTLADDEVAVKRDVVRAAEALWPRARAAALEAGEDA